MLIVACQESENCLQVAISDLFTERLAHFLPKRVFISEAGQRHGDRAVIRIAAFVDGSLRSFRQGQDSATNPQIENGERRSSSEVARSFEVVNKLENTAAIQIASPIAKIERFVPIYRVLHKEQLKTVWRHLPIVTFVEWDFERGNRIYSLFKPNPRSVIGFASLMFSLILSPDNISNPDECFVVALMASGLKPDAVVKTFYEANPFPKPL